MNKKILLFDIDGTLLLSGGAGLIAFEKAFEECFQIKDSWGRTKPDGKTDTVIFQEIAQEQLGRTMTDEELENLSQKYLAYFSPALKLAPNFRTMPGTHALLDRLSQRNDVLLAVATGNYKNSAMAKLSHAKMDHYFPFGAYGCDSEYRPEIIQTAMMRAKQHLDNPGLSNDAFIVIGDTPHDIHAGKENGARTVAVATGSYDKDTLKTYDPNIVLDDFLDTKKNHSLVNK